jgi:hypothetical protein
MPRTINRCPQAEKSYPATWAQAPKFSRRNHDSPRWDKEDRLDNELRDTIRAAGFRDEWDDRLFVEEPPASNDEFYEEVIEALRLSGKGWNMLVDTLEDEPTEYYDPNEVIDLGGCERLHGIYFDKGREGFGLDAIFGEGYLSGNCGFSIR